ncbi:long-chain fatty acid--CoA ligase [Brumimicrobium salinarum]|uniref:Long-chain fatty acid--CoA ligase n=1 Tax=Brumimicrobium salinarum TaxID=2058658 RepID=A0A2I0R036_9FLAO|nr:AMP-dependent synthetase/ligase [Brumimicrobium salinarum]PKR79923.1 long-chain fatty acid--CoA ligase [Brumimicrobium salinarum]
MKKQERLFDIVYHQLENFPQETMFSTKIDGKWVSTSTKEFVEKVNLVSRGLIALGVEPGEKVAMVSGNRVEWNIMDIGIQQIGAIGVPVYPNISTKDYKYIFGDADIKVCFTGDEELYNKIHSIKAELPTLNKIFCFDEVEGATHWSKVMDEAEKVDITEVENRSKVIKNGDLATMIYTSGTTGNPKGVMLSHNNILSNVYGSLPRIPGDSNSRCLTFLPVCHVYERMLHYLYMHVGFSIHFAESLDTIGENIKEVKPHVFTAVPRLIEKVYAKIIAKGDELTGIKRALFFWAVSVGEEFEQTGKSGWYKFKLKIARKLIFSKWQEALGGEVLAIASGAAALQPRLARIFLAAEIPILEGYGLTETSPVISVNCLKNGIKFGTVGPLLDNVEVKFAEDGEIIVKGPSVMMGYYNQPEKTKEVLTDDGWFSTGDIGEMIDGKFLKITDRKKEIFKTSGGKYIIPQMMENKFKESRFIEQLMVIGEGQKHPAAFVIPAYDFVREWAHRKGVKVGDDNKSLVEHPDVIERIAEEIEVYNGEFGQFEKIKKFELLPEEFSVEKGEITPTLKFKRKKILEIHADLVEKIYGNQ